MAVTRRLIATGRVQGVGFRQFVLRIAHELNVTGWVRNRADGTVEAIVCGDAAAVEAMIDRARRGPAGACPPLRSTTRRTTLRQFARCIDAPIVRIAIQSRTFAG